ncbi:hypothetical protein [Hydrogenivirga sp. 128-5-R1-1]|uniref:hypothetical protein n=1 Tax=Hydrogenivirga sp. 128-5-R1-1 TaxID=392423 RepID=UPI00015F3936|nr:hypothetical protein [Hydrogenivirga sp. 128-5-R1-1]EDP75105.1 3-isopropylmalate dehydratase [Hydrogenivirga sp. 128-5-R1-1]
MKVKGDVVKEILEELKSLPFVEEVYITSPREGADVGLLIKGRGKASERIHDINTAVNSVATSSDNPEEWVFVSWEWEEVEGR